MSDDLPPTGECPGTASIPVDGRCRVCGQDAVSPRGRLKRHGRCVRDDGQTMTWTYDR